MTATDTHRAIDAVFRIEQAKHIAGLTVLETAGALTRGMTVIDQRTLRERAAPNCEVLTTVAADAAFDLVADAIRSFSR